MSQEEGVQRQVQELQEENERLRQQVSELSKENEHIRRQLQEAIMDRDRMRERWRMAVQAGARKPGAAGRDADSTMSSRLRDALRE